MKLIIPDYFESCTLKQVSKNPPDKKIIFWGKIEDFSLEKEELTLSESGWNGKISLYKVSQEHSDKIIKNKGNIGKFFGNVKLEGLEIVQFIPWNGEPELLDKMNKLVFK